MPKGDTAGDDERDEPQAYAPRANGDGEEIDQHFQKGRGEQNLDDGFVELGEKRAPERLTCGWRQPIGAVASSGLGDLRFAQPAIRFRGKLSRDVGERAHVPNSSLA